MRRKRKKPLLSFTKNKLLHSITKGKSAYFYFNNGKLSSSKSSNHSFTNGLWENLSSSREDGSVPNIPSANRTRFSLKGTNPYSKLTYGGIKYVLPVVCITALLLVAGLAINPVTEKPTAYAANEGIALLADASLQLSVGNTNLTRQDTKAGEVNYITTSVNVNAANVDGYKVYVQAAPGSSATLTNGDTDITGVGSNVDAGSFADNRWGYALDSTGTAVQNLSYTSVPENGATMNPAYTTNATTENKNFTLAFAAKFSKSAPAGHYSTNVLLSAVAGAKEVTEGLGFNGITEMQQMTSTVCSSAASGLEGRLKDTRDEKVYWVGKLKDGKCWMTQNLALDLNMDEALTSNDSNVTNDWTPEYSTQETLAGWGEDYFAPKSYNPGEYIYITPNIPTRCEGGELDDCSSHGWINVKNGLSDWTATYNRYFIDATSYIGTDGYSVCNKNSGVIFGDSSYPQCKIYYYAYEHYLAGNYYSWIAATAGSGNSSITNTTTVKSSICPKGWMLPDSSSSYSYYRLFLSYGENQDKTLLYGMQDIRLSPLYFTYSGIATNDGLQIPGGIGRYWTSTGGTSWNTATHLSFTTTIEPYVSLLRYYGLSVRCVANNSPEHF